MIKFEEILNECTYKTSRSGGAGGQHVNKVETKVEIAWHIDNSQSLNEKQKELLKDKLSKRINNKGELTCTAQQSRSQVKNKKKAQEKLKLLIEQALHKKKKRRKTKVPKGVKEKRLKVKRIKSETKANRKKIKW